MQKTSQQTQESVSSETWFDKVMEGSRQALLENKRKYPRLDLEHYEATGEFRSLAPVLPPDATKADYRESVP